MVNAERVDCSNVGADGISANQGAKVIATRANCSHAGRYGLHAWNSGVIEASNAIVTNAGEYGVYATRGSLINFEGGDAGGAKSKGIYATRGSTVNALKAVSRKKAIDGNDDTVVWAGGIVNFVYGIGGTSQNINVITSNGIIFH